MIGTKFYKGQFTFKEYDQCAEWCNSSQEGTIIDKGEYYECVAIEVEETPATPSQLDIIEAQVMYTALMTDTLIESEVE